MSVLLVGMALELKLVIETNLTRVSYHCRSCFFDFNSYLKQLYISNKTEHFNYKSGCAVMCIKEFKGRAGLGYRETASKQLYHLETKE